jgi:hypothetical protein
MVIDLIVRSVGEAEVSRTPKKPRPARVELSGLAVIVVENTAQHCPTAHGSFGFR